MSKPRAPTITAKKKQEALDEIKKFQQSSDSF